MKVGVIGVGYWGRKHVEEYKELGLDVAVFDEYEPNMKISQEKFGVVPYSSLDKLLTDDEVFGVSVCTPNNTHYNIAKRALLAGKHVMVEKPMVMNVDDADDLIRTSRENKRNIVAGYLYRFNNAINYAKSQIKSGDLGDIRSLEFRWTNMEPVWHDRDIIFDLGAHPVDMSMYLLGSIPASKIHAYGDSWRQANEEKARINYHIGRTVVDIDASWINPIKTREISIIGSQKTLQIDAITQSVRKIDSSIDSSKRNIEEVSVQPNNTIRDELSDFVERSKKGDFNYKNALSSREVIRILQDARNAVSKQREDGAF